MRASQKKRAEALLERAALALEEAEGGEGEEQASASPWFFDYKDRPLDFIRDKLGEKHRSDHPTHPDGSTWWAFSVALVEAVFKHRFVAVAGCRGSSKSHTLVYLILAFLLTRKSRVVVTAQVARTVDENLMGGARDALMRSGLDGRVKCNQRVLRVDERHFAIGFAAKDPDSARGWNATPIVPGDPNADALTEEELAYLEELEGEVNSGTALLVVMDEATAMNPQVYQVYRGMATKPNVYIVMTGNPSRGQDDDHPYVHAFRPDSNWYTFRVSAFPLDDYPNDTDLHYDEEYAVPGWIVDDKARDDALAEYDIEDLMFRSDWLGLFGRGSSDAVVIPRSALVKARDFYTLYPSNSEIGPRMGVDLGFGGNDPCVAVLAMNGRILCGHEWRVKDDSQTAQIDIKDTIIELAISWGAQIGQQYPEEWDGRPLFGPRRLSVDASGSTGVPDNLAAAGVDCDRVNFGSGPVGDWPELVRDMRFQNVRCEMGWVARRGLQEGWFQVPVGMGLEKLWDELQWTQYELGKEDGQRMVKFEPKLKIKERKGRSPDWSDAAWLAWRSGQHGPSALRVGAGGTKYISSRGAEEKKQELRVGPTPEKPWKPARHRPGSGWKNR